MKVTDYEGHLTIVSGNKKPGLGHPNDKPGRFLRAKNRFSTGNPQLLRKKILYVLLSPCPNRNLGRTIGIRGNVVGRLLLIDAAGAVAVLVGWYFLFAAYNRRKGAEALRWVQAACTGKGRLLDSQWVNSSWLYARLQFPSRSFENARVTMKFRPRPLPIHWLISHWRKQKETLTFEADLGGSPSFQMEVIRHRWAAHSRGVSARRSSDRQWEVYEPGPVILTTRTHWKQDPAAEIHALMTVRQQDVLQVQFRPESPQFSATIALDALHDPSTAAGFLTTLRELAAGASAHRQ
jgi:hypothetical protein